MVQFFDPSQEIKIKQRRRMAEMLQKQGGVKPTEVVSGFAVPQSGLEHLARGLASGIGSYQDAKAAKDEEALAKSRQDLLSQALEKLGTDQKGAGAMLAQDPSMLSAGLGLITDANKTDRAQILADTEWRNKERMAKQERDNALIVAGVKAGNITIDAAGKPIPVTAENAPPRKMSATEQKEFFEKSDAKDSGAKTLSILDQVDDIRKKPMFTGMGSTAAAFANRIPIIGAMVDDVKAGNTTAYNNLLKEVSYSRLKELFPGAISNAERESLEKLQALSSYSKPEQDRILEESRKLVERLYTTSSKAMQGIASGDVYKDAAKADPSVLPNTPKDMPPEAKKAPDGNYYIPDPNRPGKYLKVN